MKNYYCQVAGLPDLAPEDVRPAVSTARFKEQYWGALSADDKKVVALFYLQYDHRNLLGLLREGEEARFDERGMFSREELIEAREKVNRRDDAGRCLPPYFYEFISRYPTLHDTSEQLPEDVLASYYYDYASRARNGFVRRWYAFNRNVNNILIALTARRHNFSAANYLVGSDEVTLALATSGARDFGLGSELDYIDDVMRIFEMSEPVERERKLDLLRWNWMEEETFFNYFSVERLFVFLLKTAMIERWMPIEKERGAKVFRTLVDRLKDEVSIPKMKK